MPVYVREGKMRVLFCAILMLAPVPRAMVADYKIDRYSINSGRGLVKGGLHKLSQPATLMACGNPKF